MKLFTGYTWVPQGDSEGGRRVIVTTIGLDYSFGLSHKFRLGIVNDFQLSSYVVEGRGGSLLEREYA